MNTKIVSNDIEHRVLEYFLSFLTRFGLSAFTVDRMAKELKMSKRTIYQHYPAKEAIINAFIGQVEARLDLHFEKMKALKVRPAKRFILTIRGVLDVLTPFLNQSIADLKFLYPEIWHSLTEYRLTKFGYLFSLLRQAQADGDLNPNLNLDRLAFLLPLILDELFQPEIVFHPSYAARDMMEEIFLILFQGIFTGEMRETLLQLLHKVPAPGV